VPSSRHLAFGIAGHAGPADFGPIGINSARRRDADLAGQRRTAVAVAAHSRQFFVDEFFRNEIERGIVLGGEARPVRRIRTARAAGLAGAGIINGWIASFHASRLARNGATRQLGRAGAYQVSSGCSQTRLLRHLALSRSRRSGYFSSRYMASTTRSVRKLRKSRRSSHHAARSRTASR
jgi:hypothetical protein